jgi:uncharacterized integral membrane protein
MTSPHNTPAQAAGGSAGQPPAPHKVHRTRAGGIWVATALFALVLLVLLVFILQNSHSVKVQFFTASGHLTLGVALLLAAVCGILLVALPGTARIIQLRRTARRHRKTDTAAAAAAPATGQQPRRAA